MIYTVDETKALLRNLTSQQRDAYGLVNAFYRFLNAEVECESCDFLVEAMPDYRYNPQTDEIGPECFTLSLTRQFKHSYEDEYWQTSLCIYFEMNSYFEKYRPQLKEGTAGIAILLIKIVLNLNKNSIWAKSPRKEKQIYRLIEDVLEHGIYQSYQIFYEYT